MLCLLVFFGHFFYDLQLFAKLLRIYKKKCSRFRKNKFFFRRKHIFSNTAYNHGSGNNADSKLLMAAPFFIGEKLADLENIETAKLQNKFKK